MRHSKSICLYCETFKGFHCLPPKDFEENITNYILVKYQNFKDYEIYNESYLAILQYIFDLTFDEEGLFIYHNVISILADLLIDNGFSYKLKIPIFLYINHLLLYEKGFSNLILSMDFFVFHEYFLGSFMQNFNLESFKFFKKALSYAKQISNKIKPKEEKEDLNEKILESVTRKKGKKNFSKTINQNIEKNEEISINKVTIPIVSWNSGNKKFEKITKEITEEAFLKNEKEEKDQVIGKLSKYFWRLHALYHLLKILQDFLKSYQRHSKEFIQQQFKDFVFQIVESTIIFNKFNDKYLPTEPFHADTECWNEIRNLLAEIMVFLIN